MTPIELRLRLMYLLRLRALPWLADPFKLESEVMRIRKELYG